MLMQMSSMSAFYGKTQILRDFSFALDEGQCVCVLGRNGVGKTTLMRSIMGLTDRTTGQIEFAGRQIGELPTHERSRCGIGYIPQGRQIFGKLSVRENILLGSFARADGQVEVPEMCTSLFPYLAENLERRAGLLSGGQQQQLAIARALAVKPKVLLLDEPTDGIQPNIVAEIGETLRMLNKELGMTLILAEQHIKVARKLSDRFLMIDNGRVVAEGDIDELTDELVDEHMTV
ncbi:urea ABC transporter ATP-binding protein [Salinisphaera orenii MK-B5]|uniref:Urea ABC transporter ATP-binding protein n=1 Tax=Salinisphaera orenii MK-B5 TaxID=856730 RepID=A0A423PF32_9GAMM|nr:urea ABC transporter ATP-binding subunit UrtE [Salinisphaera orenii]ROO24197.1 urea ABC transporter ATP-binding protein [Salinisphaera orenii MK-B5]